MNLKRDERQPEYTAQSRHISAGDEREEAVPNPGAASFY